MVQTIETIINNLAKGYAQLEKGTFQEASEIQISRRDNPELRNNWFYTANLPIFRMNQGQLEYGLSGRQAFDAIAGANIAEFCRQIREKGAYTLTSQQTEQLEELDSDIVWQKAKALGLKKDSNEWSYFLINTSELNGESLNPSQKRFAAKAHGSMETKHDINQEHSDYGETMKMLQPRISQTRLWLPTESHIIEYVQNGKVVAQASRLYGFGGNFGADVHGVGDHYGLRGVRVGKVSEADVQKLVPCLKQKCIAYLENTLVQLV